MAIATKRRVAKVQLEKLVGRQTLNVRMPRDISGANFGQVGKSILEIIRDHTGCSCLSGVIDVVLHEELEQSITVDLG